VDKAFPSAERVIEELGLVAHPEGGWFRETFRATSSALDTVRGGERAASTAIYFLLRSGEFSAFHRVCSDELWHHYLGDPLELTVIEPQGALLSLKLGAALGRGERPQAVVPRDHFQAARLSAGRAGFALCGCTVAPGFEFADFEMPPRAELLERFPRHTAVITSLTR
jgi:predicted cupin superfamily sugar epimerase